MARLGAVDSNQIINASLISTPNASYYAPQKVEYLSADTSTPAGIKDANQRQEGRTQTIKEIVNTTIPAQAPQTLNFGGQITIKVDVNGAQNIDTAQLRKVFDENFNSEEFKQHVKNLTRVQDPTKAPVNQSFG